MDINDILLLENKFKFSEISPGGGLNGKRWVAVIGINIYPEIKTPSGEIGPLKTADNDASAVQDLLIKDYGYQSLIEPLLNKKACTAGFVKLFNALEEKIGENDQVVIYYAGHGNEDDVGNEGFWIPYADEEKEYRHDNYWISHTNIKRHLMSHCKARQVLLVSDSCYAKRLTERQITRQINPPLMDPRKKLLASIIEKASRCKIRSVFTSGGNEPVFDGGGGGHSVFCYHFLDLLKRYDGNCLLFNDVTCGLLRLAVQESTLKLGRQQTPHLGFLSEDTIPFLFFREGGSTRPSKSPQLVEPSPIAPDATIQPKPEPDKPVQIDKKLQKVIAEDVKQYQESVKDGKGISDYIKDNCRNRLEDWQCAADLGLSDGQWFLGVCYGRGYGVEADQTKAVELFRKAATEGHATAQYYLGELYDWGIVVKKNPTEAAKWYRKAAGQGHIDAQFSLGEYYYNGESGHPNLIKAAEWFSKAADNGDSVAKERLSVINNSQDGENK